MGLEDKLNQLESAEKKAEHFTETIVILPKDFMSTFESKPENQSFLCNMRISSIDKERIQRAVFREKMTFQQYAIESVERRINGKQPIKQIRRRQFKNFDTVITCRFNKQQRKLVHKAANKEGISITDYVLGAVFGDYSHAPHLPVHRESIKTRATNPKRNNTPGSSTGQQSFLCNMRIGSIDKERVQKAAHKQGMTFQQFTIESVKRRINGEPPIKHIRRKQLRNFDTVITCRFNEQQRKRIRKEAKLEGVSITDYVLAAVFGEYSYAVIPPINRELSKPHEANPKRNTNSASTTKKQLYFCTMRIGSSDKSNIQNTARTVGMTFQRFAVESVFRRIAGKPPVKEINQKQSDLFNSTISCHFNEWQRNEIQKAANTAGESISEYVLNAVFGNYHYLPEVLVQERRNSRIATKMVVRQIRPLSEQREQKQNQTFWNNPELRLFFKTVNKEPTFLFYIPVGYHNNAQIQKILRKTGKTIQQFVLEKVFHRLIGRPPIDSIKHPERMPSLCAYTVIQCHLTHLQRRLIHKDALAAGITIPIYIREAILGDYTPRHKLPKTKKDSTTLLIKVTASEKERIQKAASLEGKTLNGYISEAVNCRLTGRPPFQIIPCSMFSDTMSEIKIPYSIVINREVNAAAKAENQSLEDYIRFAIFGNYRFQIPDFDPNKETLPPDPKEMANEGASDEKTESDEDFHHSIVETAKKNESYVYRDYAHTDYESMYRCIILSDPRLEPFINELRLIPPPQHGESPELYRLAMFGDKRAHKRLAEMYIRTAVRIAYFSAKQFDLDLGDCINNACIGLLDALNKADTDSNRRVSAQLGWRIRNSVLRASVTLGFCLRLPPSFAFLFSSGYPRLKEKGCLACKDLLYCAKIRELLSALTGSSSNHIDYFIRIIASNKPLETVYKDRSEVSVTDDEENPDIETENIFEFPDDEYDVDHDLVALKRRQLVRIALRSLDYREREIISLRHGLCDGYEYTLEEIGHIFLVSRERIRQILKKAYRKLNHYFQINCFDPEDWMD